MSSRARARLYEIAWIQPVGGVELVLALLGIGLAVQILVMGGDATFQDVLGDWRVRLPHLQTGRMAVWGLLFMQVVRVYAVLYERLRLRLWLARLQTLFWLVIILSYLVADVFANELSIYAVCLALNIWLQLRLDHRDVISRRSSGGSSGGDIDGSA